MNFTFLVIFLLLTLAITYKTLKISNKQLTLIVLVLFIILVSYNVKEKFQVQTSSLTSENQTSSSTTGNQTSSSTTGNQTSSSTTENQTSTRRIATARQEPERAPGSASRNAIHPRVGHSVPAGPVRSSCRRRSVRPACRALRSDAHHGAPPPAPPEPLPYARKGRRNP